MKKNTPEQRVLILHEFSEVKREVLKNENWRFYDTAYFCFVAQGELALKTLSKTIWASEGELLFIAPKAMHCLSSVPESSRCETIHLDPDFFSGIADGGVFEEVSTVLKKENLSIIKASEKTNNGKRLISCFKSLANIKENSPLYLAKSATAALNIIIALNAFDVAKSSKESKRSLTERKLADMLRYIDAHYSSQITTSDIGKAVGVKERECLRIFQSSIGISPGQYVLQKRISKAAEMLSGAKILSVSEIAKECGFVSSSYFIKMFKRAYGKTPGQYAEQSEVGSKTDNPLDALSDFFDI